MPSFLLSFRLLMREDSRYTFSLFSSIALEGLVWQYNIPHLKKQLLKLSLEDLCVPLQTMGLPASCAATITSCLRSIYPGHLLSVPLQIMSLLDCGGGYLILQKYSLAVGYFWPPKKSHISRIGGGDGNGSGDYASVRDVNWWHWNGMNPFHWDDISFTCASSKWWIDCSILALRSELAKINVEGREG